MSLRLRQPQQSLARARMRSTCAAAKRVAASSPGRCTLSSSRVRIVLVTKGRDPQAAIGVIWARRTRIASAACGATAPGHRSPWTGCANSYVALLILGLAPVTFFPKIALWPPGTMQYK
jgi:hypothetical protein